MPAEQLTTNESFQTFRLKNLQDFDKIWCTGGETKKRQVLFVTQAVRMCKFCRYRKMQKSDASVAKIGVDRADRERTVFSVGAATAVGHSRIDVLRQAT